MPRDNFPSLNMNFVVQFHESEFRDDAHFQSVQGLKARICENEGKSGTHVKYENLILKRAYQPDSKLVQWCMDAINHNKNRPINLTVQLLNSQLEPVSGWKIEKAVAVAWGIDELHAQESKILIETIELSYQRFYVLNSKGKVIAPTPPIILKNKSIS